MIENQWNYNLVSESELYQEKSDRKKKYERKRKKCSKKYICARAHTHTHNSHYYRNRSHSRFRKLVQFLLLLCFGILSLYIVHICRVLPLLLLHDVQAFQISGENLMVKANNLRLRLSFSSSSSYCLYYYCFSTFLDLARVPFLSSVPCARSMSSYLYERLATIVVYNIRGHLLRISRYTYVEDLLLLLSPMIKARVLGL